MPCKVSTKDLEHTMIGPHKGPITKRPDGEMQCASEYCTGLLWIILDSTGLHWTIESPLGMERPPPLDRLPLLRELMVTSDRFLDAVATLATLPCCFHVESKVSKCHGYDGYDGRVKSGLKILIRVKYPDISQLWRIRRKCPWKLTFFATLADMSV